MQTIKASSIIAEFRRRLYGRRMSRKPLFKAVTGVLAVEMAFTGLAPAVYAANLPQSSGGYGAGMTVDGSTLTIDGAQGAGSSFTWDQGFNIGQGYTVQFQNIGTAVNKDTSGQLSSILGNLLSSGAVYILNPNGILFGSSAVVDVHGLVAAAVGSVGKDPEGGMVFSKLGSGDVVNQGSISAGDFAYLVGKSVENSGSISANDVVLAAFGGMGADSLTIAQTEDGATFSFKLPETMARSAADGDGEDQGGNVVSSGVITGIRNEQANAGAGRREVVGPINQSNGNILYVGNDVDIVSSASGKNVIVNGKKNVSIGNGGDIEIKATDGNVKVTANEAISINEGAQVIAEKGGATQGGNITMTANNGSITIGGGVNADNGKGAMTLTSTEGVKQTGGGMIANTITVNGSGNTLTQSGGEVTASKVTAGAVLQKDGKITVNTLKGDFTQTGGKVEMKGTTGSLTFDGTVTQKSNGHGGTGIIGDRDNTVIMKSLTQNAGSINAGILTLKANSTVNGTVDATTINGAGTITQNAGNGRITATTIKNAVVQEKGTIAATVFDSTVEQKADGKIVSKDANGVTFAKALEADKQKGLIDATGSTLTLSGGGTLGGTVNAGEITGSFTQDGGTITAGTINNGVVQKKGTIKATTFGGSVEQWADGKIVKKDANGLTFKAGIGADMQKGEIDASHSTLTLERGGTLDGTVSAKDIVAKNSSGEKQVITARGTVSADTIEASALKASGTVKADTIDANVTQTAGTISRRGTASELTFKDTVTQNGSGTIGGTDYNVRMEKGLTQDAGMVNASILGLGAASTVKGTVNAATIANAAALTQAGGQISANTVNGAFKQTDGKVVRKDSGALTFKETVEQNGTGTIGGTGYNVVMEKALTQAAGTINAGKLTLGAASTVKGTVNAGTIANAALLTQNDGTIKTGTIEGDFTQTKGRVEKSGTSLTFNGIVKQDGTGTIGGDGDTVTINGLLDQDSGTINAKYLTINALDQESEGIINAKTLKLNGEADQAAGAKIAATSVSMAASGKTVALNGNNEIQGISGTAKEITVNNADGLELGAITANSLTVKAGGDVTQSGIANVAGATSVEVAEGSKVALDKSNKFGSVGVVGKDGKSAGAVTIKDAEGMLALDAVRAASLTVSAVGDVSQVAGKTVNVANLTDISATGKGITLGNDGNALGSFKATGAAVTVKDDSADGLILDAIKAASLDVTAAGAVSQNAAANISGATSVKVADGSDVDLNNTGNKFNSVGVVGKSGTAGAVTVVDSDGALALDAIKAASLNVTAGGALSQNAAADISGATTVKVKNNSDVNLGNGGNKFGSVGVAGATLKAGAVTVADSDGDLVLDDIKAASLEVTAAGDVGQTAGAKLDVTGLADITAAGKDITLGNDGNALGSFKATGAAVTVKEDSANGLALDDISADGLAVTAKGAVTQVAGKTVNVTGLADITATGKDITLGNDGNALGSFKATGAAVTVKEDSADGLVLDAIKASSLKVTAAGAVSQDAAAEVSGKTAVTVADGSKVDLSNAGNKFNSIGVAGKDGKAGEVTIVDSNLNLALNAVKAESLDVTAAGDVSQSAAAEVSGKTSVKVADGKKVVLGNAGNKFGSVGVAGASGKAGAVTIVDSEGDLALDDVRAASLAVTSVGEVSQSNGAKLEVTGLADVTANEISLDNAENDLGSLKATANAGSILVRDANKLAITQAKTTSTAAGDVRVIAQGDLTVNGEVSTAARSADGSAGNVRLESSEGKITVSSAVSGNNVTLAAKGNVTEGAAVNAAADKYVVSDNGDIKVKANATVGGNVAYVAKGAGKRISTEGDGIVIKAGDGGTAYQKDSGGTVLSKGGSSTSVGGVTTFTDASIIAIDTTDRVVVNNNGVAVTVGTLGGEDAITVTEVLADPAGGALNNGTDEVVLVGNGGDAAVSGINAADVDVNVTGDIVGDAAVTVAKSIAVSGGNIDISAEKGDIVVNDTLDDTANGGEIILTANAGDINVNNATVQATGDNGAVKLNAAGDVVIDPSVVTSKGDIDIDATGDVTIEASQVTSTGGKITIGKNADIGGDVNIRAANGTSSVVKGKTDVEVKASGAITVDNSTVKSDTTSVRVKTSGVDKTIEIKGSSLVEAKDYAEIVATAGTVALNGTATIKVTGGASASNPAIAITGAKGVTSVDGTLIDATGAKLAVNAETGEINLAGKILAKDADFTAKKDNAGQAITADNDDNNFTGDVTADGASVTLKDSDSIILKDVKATAGNVDVTAGKQITATAVEASGNAMLTATAEGIEVTSVKAGTESGVATLLASQGEIKKSGAGKVTAKDLQATAKTGIDLNTAVETVTADNTGEGGIVLNEADAVTLTHVKAANGNVEVTAGKQITATDVEASGNATLTATAEGIEVVSVNAGTAGGVATLSASQGEIKKSGAGKVTVKDLQATAKTGINLNTAVETVTADNNGAGSIVLNEDDALTVAKASATDGDIRIKAANNLIVADAEDVKVSGKDIRLESTGGSITVGAGVGGRNVTLDAKTTVETKKGTGADGALTAAEGDLYVKAGGNVTLAAAQTATAAASGDNPGGVMAVESDGKIQATGATTAKTLYTKDADGAEFASVSADGASAISEKNIKFSFTKDVDVAFKSTGGSVEVESTGNVTVKSATAADEDIAVTEVKWPAGTEEITLIDHDDEDTQVNGIEAATTAIVTSTGDGKNVTVETQVIGGEGVVLTAEKGDVVIGTDTAANAKVKAGTFDETTHEVSGAPAKLTITAGRKVAIQNLAQVGASGEAEVTANGDDANGGVTITGSDPTDPSKFTTLVADKSLKVRATGDNAGVMVSDGAYVGANDKTEITSVKGAVTVTGNGTKVEAGKDLSITAAKDATVKAGAKVGADGLLTIQTTGDEGSVKVNTSARAYGKEGVTLTSAKNNVEVDGALVKAGTFMVVDETTGEVSGVDDGKTLKIEAANGKVALLNNAKLGASGEVDVGAGAGGVEINNAKLVAASNKKMDIKATAGKVDILGGAYVAGYGTLDITTTGASEAPADQVQNVTVNGSTVESTGDLTITAAGDVITDADSRIGTDGNLTITATGATGIDADGLLVADKTDSALTKLTANNGAIDARNAGNDLRKVEAAAKGSISIVDKDGLVVSKVRSEEGNVVVKTGKADETADKNKMTLQEEGVFAKQNVTLVAEGAIDQNAIVKADAGDVWIEAQGGDVTMKADDATVKTVAGGNAYIAATGAKSEDPTQDKAGDVKLTIVEAANGKVSVFSEDGSIVDNLQGDGDAANIAAKGALLQAGVKVGGTDAADIDTTVENIEVMAGKDSSTEGTDAFVHNTAALEIGSVDGVTVKKVDTATSSASSTENNAGADLVGAKATAGNLSIVADGKMTVTEAVNAGNNAILNTTAGDIVLNDAVTASQDATVVAAGAIDQNKTITAKNGDVWIQAQGGNVTMKADDDSVRTVAEKGGVYVAATGEGANAGDVSLTIVEAKKGTVSVFAADGSIIDNLQGADDEANVLAKKARLQAKNAIGGAGAGDIDMTLADDQSAGKLELEAQNGDAFVHNTAALEIGGVDGVTVKKVDAATASASSTENNAGADIVGAKATVGNLSIVADGEMTVSEAVEAGNNAVLETTAGDIVLNAAVTAGNNATILAKAGVQQNAGITATAGDAWVEAQGGDVAMADGTTTKAGRNARVAASANVELSSVKAENGSVSVKATAGDITDNTTPGEDANIVAKNLRLEAGNAIGGEADADIDTSVDNVELLAGADAYVQNDKALTVGGVNGVTTRKVKAADATPEDVTDADITGAGAKSAAGDIRVEAKGDLTIAEAVSTAARPGNDTTGNIRLESTAGEVVVNSAVSGNNVTLKGKTDVTAGANVDAARDLYVMAGGDMELNAAATAGETMALDAGGNVTANAAVKATAGNLHVKAGSGNIAINDGATAGKAMALIAKNGRIDANAVEAKSLYTSDGKGLKIDAVAADSLGVRTGGDFEATLGKDKTSLAVEAGGNVTIHANGYSLKIDAGAASGDAAQLEVTEVLPIAEVVKEGENANGGVREVALESTRGGGGAIDGIVSLNGDASIDSAQNVSGTSLSAVSGDVYVDATGDYTVNTTAAGGAIDLDVGGNAEIGSANAKGEANLDIGGSLKADAVSGNPVVANVRGSTQIGSVDGGSVNVISGGEAQFGSVNGGRVEIDAGGVTTTGAGIKSSDLVINSRGNVDVTLDSQKITSIEGRDVKIVEKAHDHDVQLGTISASGNLDLEATQIGIGNHGATGYRDANGDSVNLSSGGNMHLNVAGRIGQASNPMEIDVGGKLSLSSGSLRGSNKDNPADPNETRLSYFYLIATGTAPNWNNIWDAYYGVKIPGLVIYKGQVYAASPDLWLKINRALAFTIDTPELKSRQGVFGSPLFVHTDMDVSEAASIGTVDYVSISDTIMDTLADPKVNNRLIDLAEENDDADIKARFDRQRKNPLGRDALYSKEFKGTDDPAAAKARADKAAAKAKAKADKAAAAEKARAEREAKRQADKAAAEKVKAEREAKRQADRAAAEKAKAEKKAAAEKAKAEREAKRQAEKAASEKASADVAMK